jgi:hypothetical protein
MAGNPRVTGGIFLSAIMALIIGAGAYYAQFGNAPSLILEKPQAQIVPAAVNIKQPLLAVKPTTTSNSGLELYYGRWTIIGSGQTLKEICKQYSTNYSSGQSVYVGPDHPSGLFRSTKLSVTGSTLVIDELGNAGDEDARKTYKIIDKNTLRGIRTEITSHRGGKKPVAMMDGTIMKRCPTLGEPSSTPTAGSTSPVEDVMVDSRSRGYDCSEKAYKYAHTKIMLAFGTGILQNDPGGGVSVLVAEDYWRRLTFPEKTGFAEKIVCATAGAGKGLSGLTLKSLSTGKVAGEWGPFAGLSVP